MKTTDYCPDRGISKGNFLMLMFFSCTIFFFSSAYTVSAQDKIITKDAESIDAVILEVNLDDVRYRKADNPEGPVYRILKSDISTIIYGNGYVEVFNESKPEKRQPRNTGHYQMYDDEDAVTIGIIGNGGCRFNPDNPMPITIMNNFYTYNGYTINSETTLQIINSFDPSIGTQFQSGSRMITAGNVLASIGGAFLGAGLGTLIWADTDTEIIVSTIFMSIGFIIGVPVAIPIYYTGIGNRNAAVNSYNSSLEAYSQKPSCEIRFGAGNYGIGFTMAF